MADSVGSEVRIPPRRFHVPLGINSHSARSDPRTTVRVCPPTVVDVGPPTALGCSDRRPTPTVLSIPGGPPSIAIPCNAYCTEFASSPGSTDFTSAAAPAMWGADADVPVKPLVQPLFAGP
jgi:hypothetical protein